MTRPEKKNGEVLADIDKKLAVMVNDVSYLKSGHKDNSEKIENIEKFVIDINNRFIAGEGKIKRNWAKAQEVNEKIECHFKNHKDNKLEAKNSSFRLIDIVIGIIMVFIAILTFVK